MMIYLSKLAKRLALAGPHAGLALVVVAFAGTCARPEEREFIGPNPSQPVPITSLSVEPKIGTAKPGEVIQFNATVKNAKGASVVADVDWSATGGTISATGTFVSEVYGQFQVTARLRSNGLIADSAKVGVFVNPQDVLKLSVTPDGTEVTEGEGVQLEATAELADGSVVLQPALSWSAEVGQVDGAGYFIAPELEGTYLVAARAASGVTASANVMVRPNRRNLERVELAPGSAILTTGETRQFTAVGIWEDGYIKSIAVAWSSTGGTITAEGLFTAAGAPGNFHVIARFKQGTQADTSFISITEPEIVGLDVAPGGTSLVVGATQQYTATARLSDGTSKPVGATWEATGGTISTAGLYSATTDGSWMVKAKVAGTTLASETAVNVSAPIATLTKVTLTPSSATVPAGTSRQFAVSGTYSDGTTKTPSATWSATGGTISVSGNYTAGSVLGTFRVIASASGKADTSAITVSSADLLSLSISPASVSLAPGTTQQFSVSGTWSNGSTLTPVVAWTAHGGTITSAGVFTAGTASGTYRVIGTHSAGRADTSLVTVVPVAPVLVSLSLTPSSVSLTPSGTRQFSVSGGWTNGGTGAPPVTYTATGGTITTGGLYKAGSTTGTFRVIAKHTGGTLADTSSVVISAAAPTLVSISLTPATTSLQTGGSRQFSVTGTWSDGSTAAPGVTWSATAGTVSGSGLFIAPTAPGTFKVIAKETDGTKADTSTVTVTNPVVVTSLSVAPGSTSLPVGQQKQFSASATYSNGGTGTPTLAWTATGGTINSGGLYTAATSTGNYRVIAQASGTNVKDTAAVTLTASTATVTAVLLSPGSTTVGQSSTLQFSLSPTWSDGATRSVTPTYSASGGTITSTGLFTAPSTLGTFKVIASCTGCSVADTSVVTVVTSTGGTGNPGLVARNQPSGHTTVFDLNFDTKDIGWGGNTKWSDPTYLQVVSDSDAPRSQSKGVEFIFPIGFSDQTSPARASKAFGAKREVYVAYWVKVSDPWQYHTSAINKLFFIGTNASATVANEVVISIKGSSEAGSRIRIAVQTPSNQGAGTSNGYYVDNIAQTGFSLGTWHLIEVQGIGNTGGLPNGRLRWWVDGTLVGDHSNVVFNATGDGYFNGIILDPNWGGQGSPLKAQRDWVRVDHLFTSGK